jgi:hypothetical protein
MPVHTKAQVLALLHKHQQELRRFGVNRCGVFGSFVRDAAHDQSDVDILVAFEPDQKTFDNFMHLTFFLEDLFGRTVDLIIVWDVITNKVPQLDAEIRQIIKQEYP